MHFNVLVVGNDVEGQMAPFQENNNGDCDEQYMVFCAATKEGNTEEFDSEDEAEKELGDKLDRDNSYWFNPNSQWDWFVVGGRWAGFFKLKDDVELLPGVAVHPDSPEGRRYVDRCRIGDIDFEGMREERRQAAEKRYDRYLEITKDQPEVRPFEHFKSVCASVYEARDQFNAQPTVQALQREGLLPWNKSIDEEYGVGREVFVAREVADVCVPFAVLRNGEWVEKGLRSLFGAAGADVTEEQWAAQVKDLLSQLPPDTVVTLVDYHC